MISVGKAAAINGIAKKLNKLDMERVIIKIVVTALLKVLMTIRIWVIVIVKGNIRKAKKYMLI